MKTLWKFLCVWVCVLPCAAGAQDEEPEPMQQTRKVSVRFGAGALPLMAGGGISLNTSEDFAWVVEGYVVGELFDENDYAIAIGFRSTLAGGRIAPFWCLEAGPAWTYRYRFRGDQFVSGYELNALFGTVGLGYALALPVGFNASISMRLTAVAPNDALVTGGAGLFVDLGWSF